MGAEGRSPWSAGFYVELEKGKKRKEKGQAMLLYVELEKGKKEKGQASMRGPLSSEAVQILCGGFPAHPPRRRLRSIWPISDPATDGGRATRNTSSEPEAEGVFFSLHAGRLRSGGRRDVIRSTIYSGSPGRPDVATQLESKGRHHSM
jgi:hypothetical protein